MRSGRVLGLVTLEMSYILISVGRWLEQKFAECVVLCEKIHFCVRFEQTVVFSLQPLVQLFIL